MNESTRSSAPDRAGDRNGAGASEHAALVAELARRVLAAPDVPAAAEPLLKALVAATAAEGAVFVQVDGGAAFVRAGSGEVPPAPDGSPLAYQEMSADSPVLQALGRSEDLLLVEEAGPDEIGDRLRAYGLSSLAGLPVRDSDGEPAGALFSFSTSPHRWTGEEQSVIASVAGVPLQLLGRRIAQERASAVREGLVRALGRAVEYRDYEVEGHTERVTELSLQVGRTLELERSSLEALRWGAYLHDVGMLTIPDRIIHKEDALDEREWEVVRGHVTTGHSLLSEVNYLPSVTLELILHHHERWDGEGYPEGLSGEEIPLVARIFSVCDAYDAMTTERPYRKPMEPSAALAEIQDESGAQFDPRVVEAFVSLRDDWTEPG